LSDPTLVPKELVEIRWLRHTDGICHGQEFFNDNSNCRASLLSLARQIAVKGRVGKVPENGHPVQDPYRPIQELKPGNYRFMGFREGSVFFLTNGAPKKKNQNADYRFALEIYNAYKNRKNRESR
jgi:hypothetical protein